MGQGVDEDGAGGGDLCGLVAIEGRGRVDAAFYGGGTSQGDADGGGDGYSGGDGGGGG